MVKILQKYSYVLPAAALALLIVVGSPSVASARQGTDSREAGVSSGQTAMTDSTAVVDDSQMSTTTSGSTSAESESESGRRESVRSRGEAKVKELRAERKTNTTVEKREKVCETRKNGLQTKFASISRNAVRYQAKVDGVFSKLPASAATTVTAEYEAAMAAKTKSEASVKALNDTKISAPVDCKNTDVAAQIAAFKVAASTARTDLKDYKMAVKDVLKALKTATPKPTESTEGTN